MTYFVWHDSHNHVIEEKLQRKITLVEPETVLRLHKTVCGVCRAGGVGLLCGPGSGARRHSLSARPGCAARSAAVGIDPFQEATQQI